VTQTASEPNSQGDQRQAAKSAPEFGLPWTSDPEQPGRRTRPGLRTWVALAIGTAILIRVAFVVAGALSPPSARADSPQSESYLGVYEPDTPGSYADIDQFAQAIGRQPNIVPYYSHWLEPFNGQFASEAANHGALTLVQIAPRNISVTAIARGRYDAYLRSYALAVRAFGGRVVLSFGHEMNGSWYSWGFRHTSATVFVAAWRHIVTIFRELAVGNVTWLWTVNIAGVPSRAPAPAPWWPGKSYVNWVGIDGYYRSPSSEFPSVFGPTIADVRELTSDPILIAETAAEPSADQSAKIADLFAGVHTFGLLGFVWFDENDVSASVPGQIQQWRLDSSSVLAAFRHDAKAFMKPLAKPPAAGAIYK
jgi:Glycosyl hydrolase family 26